MRTIPVVVALSLLLWIAALPGSRPGARAADEPLLVIVATSFPIQDIKLALLRRAFEGLATELGGKAIIPINHPNEASTRIAFDRAILGLEPDAVGHFWIDRRIRDEASPPRAVRSEELALRVVASLPGAITYVSPRLLNPSVKALSIEGKSPGEAGYVLE